MTVAIEPRDRRRIVTETARRRWRLAVLLALLTLLALTAYVVVSVERDAQANRTVAVLKAARDIRMGTTITSEDLDVAYVRVDDSSILPTLVGAGDRASLLGRVATDRVRAGALVPAGLGEPQASAGMWTAPLPVRRMPRDLRAGDHVALLVSPTAHSGDPIEFVAMQDVQVLAVRSDSVDLWMPAAAVAQMQWYADHGGIVAIRMVAGAAQPNLPAGSGG